MDPEFVMQKLFGNVINRIKKKKKKSLCNQDIIKRLRLYNATWESEHADE